MPWTVAERNAALDNRTIDRMRLHSGDPGSAGTDNELGAGLIACTFNAAASGERVLASDVVFTGLGVSASVTHVSLWLNSGTVFKASFTMTGAANANTDGAYTVKATTTKITAT